MTAAPSTTELSSWIEAKTSQTSKLPSGRNITEYGYVLAGFGQHRDSEALEQSNFAVAARTLLAHVGQQPSDISYLGQPWYSDTSDDERDEREAVVVASFGHFAYGWVEELLVRDDRADLLAIACELSTYVAEQYPVLDDADFAEREYASNHPDADELCYSDDGDCSCGRERA